MRIEFPQLDEVVVDRRGHPDPEQRKEDELVTLPDGSYLASRFWSVDSIPKSDRWQEKPDPSILPFARTGEDNSPIQDYEEGYNQYVEFQRQTQCISHLSAFTGQLAYAFGNLWPGVQGNSDEHAQEFLQTYQLMWAGRSGDVGQRRVRRSSWRDGTTSLNFQQVNSQDIPVLGGRIVLTYDSEQRLATVNNTLFPMAVDELPAFEQIMPATDQIEKNIRAYLEAQGQSIKFESLVYVEFGDQLDFVKSVRPYELWVLPLIRENRGMYSSAYRTFFVDAQGHYWALWLDATELEPLFLERRESHNRVGYHVYPRPRDAVNGQKRKRQLDLGGAATTLNLASRVKVRGDRFYDPQDPSLAPIPSISSEHDPRNVLAANAFHHLWEMQYDFVARMLDLAEDIEDSHQVNGRIIANPINEIAVSLESTSGEGVFSWETGQIMLHTGVSGFPPVIEPGFDGDVIVHEYTHAILHYYYRSLFENRTAIPLVFTAFEAIDEALAFYYACVHFNDARWGEFAYAGFGNRNFTDAIAPFNDVWAAANATGGSRYEYALWWAHILWRLHQHASLQTVLPILLLQVLRSLAESPPAIDAAAGTAREKLFTIFNRIADQIYLRAQEGDERDAIAEIWQQPGFALPS
jgi:hypothetical protein